jgi:hypothetical protein
MRALLPATSLHILLISLLIVSGCAKRSQDQFVPGTTTVMSLRTTLGEPAHTWTPTVRPAARLLDYPDGCSYQVERDIVVGIACPPAPGEVTLQYWRHKWVGDAQRFEELPGSANPHGQRQFQLASKQAAMAVIYDEATDRVVQVVKYERN